jgi:MFS family permease
MPAAPVPQYNEISQRVEVVPLSVLKNRNFALLLSGQLISTAGNNLFAIALPWYIYTLTQSKADLALAGIAQTLPALLGLAAGVFVDRWRKTTTMLTSDLVRAGLGALLVAAVMARQPIWTVLIIVLVLQAVGTFYSPAAGALMPTLVEPSDITSASGMQQSGNAAAQLFGTVAGGSLLAALGPALLFALDGVSYLASVVSVLLIRRRGPEPTQSLGRRQRAVRSNRAFFEDWRDGLNVFTQSRFLLLMMVSAVMANFAFAPLDIALTAWVKGPMQEDSFHLGLLNAGFFVGMIGGSLSLNRVSRTLSLRGILFIGMCGSGLCTMGLGLRPNFWWDTALTCAAGLCIGILNGSVNAALLRAIPAAFRGRALSTLSALVMLAVPLGMAIFGALMVHLPLAVIFVLIGSLSVLSGLVFILPIREDLSALARFEAAHVSPSADEVLVD